MSSFSDVINGFSGTLDSLSGMADTVVDVASNAGIAGFVFHVAKETTAEFANDITDHYIEDGTVVQDMIAHKPITLTLSGFVGEYTNIVEDEKSGVQKVAEKLTVVSNYAKTISNFAKQTLTVEQNINNKDYVDAVVNGGTSLYGLYQDMTVEKNEQTKAFAFFEALRERGTTIKVKTPWKNYSDMVIETLVAKQDAETKDITDFEVKLKQIRRVKTINSIKQKSLQSRCADMISDFRNSGADFCEKVGFEKLGNFIRPKE